MLQFKLPVAEYRALKFPYKTSSGKNVRLGMCFARVGDLPTELGEWMEVNPRVPKLDRKEHLKGPVAKAIVDTLRDEPEKMSLRNNGITILVDEMLFDRASEEEGSLTITLSDSNRHGIANGGHTFTAIREVEEDDSVAKPIEAYVRVFFVQGVEKDDIADMAEGLNRSLQVDDKSLENLKSTFDEIKKALDGKPGADQIAYRQGDLGEIDIMFVLTVMAMLDLNVFPDRKSYPHTLFGQPKVLLQTFVNARKNGGQDVGYKRMLPKLHEILRLTDEVQRAMADELGRLKIKETKKSNRVASAKHKDEPAYFAGGKIGGHIPLGWLYPVVAAFRANIDPKAWATGKFRWLADPFDVLKETTEEMCSVIRQEHADNKDKPAEVGRKEAAYRGCYGIVLMELAGRGAI
ncbi:AIPR family protein [Hyphomicrobium sp. DY-1]|uniref:AIPR family protein n=1 Tax=Hyphomicrobium sp. DY-1 TaxID=3075650 RepID=UPI0039C10DD7